MCYIFGKQRIKGYQLWRSVSTVTHFSLRKVNFESASKVVPNDYIYIYSKQFLATEHHSSSHYFVTTGFVCVCRGYSASYSARLSCIWAAVTPPRGAVGLVGGGRGWGEVAGTSFSFLGVELKLGSFSSLVVSKVREAERLAEPSPLCLKLSFGCNVLCFIRTCCFNPFSEVDVYSHCSHLNESTAVFSAALGVWGAETAGSLTTSSVILDFLASLLLSSLRIWLGDFLFKLLPQELATSSLLSNLKVSFPMERVKLNFWLEETSAWQKARHLSIVASIWRFASSHCQHFLFIFWSWNIVAIISESLFTIIRYDMIVTTCFGVYLSQTMWNHAKKSMKKLKQAKSLILQW